VSTRFSPDGMYYWDGAQWASTLSPDGRYRWDGASWVPTRWTGPAAASQAQPAMREPTSWTRPLQYAVAGWYAISALIALTLPFWMGGMMAQMMNAAFQQQQQLNPDVAPPPQSFLDAMTSMMTGVVWFAALFAFGLALLVIVGALKRWTWIFYAVLILLGFGAVSEPFNLLNLSTGSFSSTYRYTPPTSLYVLGLVSWVPSTALFVWMLVAVVKRGPWAMRKVTPASSPAA
jgi:uncharacterized membrane protein